MLRTAGPTYTLKEWGEHSGKVDIIKQYISATQRRRHQQAVARKIVNNKQALMKDSHKPSMTLLNSERRIQL